VLQSIVLSDVTIQEAIGVTTNVAPGVTTLFSNVTIALPTGAMLLNGYNLNAFENLLNGGQVF